MTDALLPCPFCGGRVEIDECAPTLDSLYGRRRWYGVTCRNTENLGGSCAVQIRPSASIEAARTRWNRRAPTLPDGWLAVASEVTRATEKFPTWPTDPLHALAVLGEEFGELTKAVLQLVYEPHKTTPDDVRIEATQTAAMALRFLASLEMYAYAASEQHAQSTGRK